MPALAVEEDAPSTCSKSFTAVAQDKQDFKSEAYLKSLLQKWGMFPNSWFSSWYYTGHYHKMAGKELILDLLNNPGSRFQVMTKKGWAQVQGPVTDVQLAVVPATATRLDVFDQLHKAPVPIVRTTGDLVKCLDDDIDGFQVSDMLRDLLLNEDSENAGVVSEDSQEELLWRVFQHLVLGGSCCQYEDQLEPYLTATKQVYKELLSVHKSPSTGKVEVASVVYELQGITSADGACLFPSTSRNNFCYVVVDPLQHLVRVWYHAYMPFW